MKKLFTIALVTLISTATYAQRTMDIAIDSIVSPKTLTSNFTTGTPVSIDIAISNKSGDDAKVGDTLLWYCVFADKSNTIRMGFPAASNASYFRQVLTKDFNQGDTMHLTRNVTFGLRPFVSQDYKIAVRVLIGNFANVFPTKDSDLSNNIVLLPIVWYNPQGWELGINDVNKEALTASPNPVADELNIDLSVVDVANDSKVEVLDIAGKVVLTSTVSKGMNTATINTTSLSNGVYFVNVLNGKMSTSAKIVVSK